MLPTKRKITLSEFFFIPDILRILRQTNSSYSFFNSGSAGGGTGNAAPKPQQFIDPSFQSTVGGASSGINGSSGSSQQNFIDPSAFLNLGNSQFSNVGSGSSGANGISGTNQLQNPGNLSNPMLFLSPGIFNNFQILNLNGGSTANQQSGNQSQQQSGSGSTSSGGTSFSTNFFQPSQFLNPGAYFVGKRKRRALYLRLSLRMASLLRWQRINPERQKLYSTGLWL